MTFLQQETTEIKNRFRVALATFYKNRQELTSKNYMLKHRLWLFDAAITPTICYASGTWAPTKEHERMIQSTQRKMLRLIIQTKRRYKKIVRQKVKTNEAKDTNDLSSNGDESEDGQSSNTHKDQDSDVSFESDNDEEIDAAETEEEEDWVDYIIGARLVHPFGVTCLPAPASASKSSSPSPSWLSSPAPVADHLYHYNRRRHRRHYLSTFIIILTRVFSASNIFIIINQRPPNGRLKKKKKRCLGSRSRRGVIFSVFSL